MLASRPGARAATRQAPWIARRAGRPWPELTDVIVAAGDTSLTPYSEQQVITVLGPNGSCGDAERGLRPGPWDSGCCPMENRGSGGSACAGTDDLSAEAQSQRLPSMGKYSAGICAYCNELVTACWLHSVTVTCRHPVVQGSPARSRSRHLHPADARLTRSLPADRVRMVRGQADPDGMATGPRTGGSRWSLQGMSREERGCCFRHGRTSGDLARLGGDRVTSRTGRWGMPRSRHPGCLRLRCRA